MNETPTLERLKELAAHRHEAHTRELATMVARRDAAQEKLRLLTDYRQEYQRRLTEVSRSGINGERLRNYRQFLAQLEHAIDQQNAIVAAAAAHVEQAKLTWIDDKRRVDSYQTLTDRRHHAKARADERQQQKLQDEAAARRRPQGFRDDH